MVYRGICEDHCHSESEGRGGQDHDCWTRTTPTRLDQLSIKGIRDLLQSLTTLQGSGRVSCELAGVLPTFYDRVTRESFEQFGHLAKSFSERILPPIPLDTQCRVATRYGKTLWEHNPETRAIVGVPGNGGLSVGGYAQVLQRLEAEL